MALLKCFLTDELIPLKQNHTFGRRQDAVDIVILDKEISGLHSTISWNGSYWEIIDTSRNGTFIDGVRLNPGTRFPLNVGQSIAFSQSDQRYFEVVDCRPPNPMVFQAKDLDSVIYLDGITPLPDPENPELSIFKDQDEWIIESNKGTTILSDKHVFELDETEWIFFNPCNHELTQIFNRSSNVKSDFLIVINPSLDLEDINVQIKIELSEEIDLGSKSHHYLLFLLARARNEDLNLGLPEQELGWVTTQQLSTMMKLEISHINIQVYRLRKALMEVLPKSTTPAQIIARKSGAIRLGFNNFQIL